MKINVFMDDCRPLPFMALCEKDRAWVLVRDVHFCQWLLEQGVVQHMSLDHDMGDRHPTGYDLMNWIEETGNWPSGDIFIHSSNPVGASRMRQVIERR